MKGNALVDTGYESLEKYGKKRILKNAIGWLHLRVVIALGRDNKGLKVINQWLKTKCESHMINLLAAFKKAPISCNQKVGNAEDQAQHVIIRGPSSRADVLSTTRSIMPRLRPCLGKNRILRDGVHVGKSTKNS